MARILRLIFPLIFLLSLLLAEASNLSISGIDVSVTYPEPYNRYSEKDDTDAGLISGAEIAADIYPGSSVEFTFDVQNIFPTSSDVDIENVIGTITVEDLNDGEDAEQDTDDIDLGPTEEQRMRITIPIPVKVEAQEYKAEIVVDGDSNASQERTVINLRMDVKKESHDIKVIFQSVAPERVSCDRSVTIKAAIANLGRNDESDAGIEIRNDALGILKRQEKIFLEQDPFVEGNEYTFTAIPIIPKDAAAGTYQIAIKALFNGLEMDRREVPVIVADCQTSKPEEKPANATVQNQTINQADKEAQEKNQTGIIEQPILAQQQNLSSAIGQPEKRPEEEAKSSIEKPFLKTPYGMGLLILGNILVLIVIIAIGVGVVIKSAKKKKAQNEEKEEGLA